MHCQPRPCRLRRGGPAQRYQKNADEAAGPDRGAGAGHRGAALQAGVRQVSR